MIRCDFKKLIVTTTAASCVLFSTLAQAQVPPAQLGGLQAGAVMNQHLRTMQMRGFNLMVSPYDEKKLWLKTNPDYVSTPGYISGEVTFYDNTARNLKSAKKALETGKYQKAIMLSEKVLAQNQNSIEAHTLNGLSYFLLRDYPKAKATGNFLIEKFPKAPNGYNLSASALHRQGKNKEALTLINQALNLTGDSTPANIIKAAILADENHLAEAVPFIETALTLSPKNDHAHVIHSLISFKAGRYQEAIVAGKQAIRYNKHLPEAYLVLSASYLATRQFDRSLSPLKKALKLSPDFPQAHSVEGYMNYLAKADIPASIQSFQTAKGLFEAQGNAQKAKEVDTIIALLQNDPSQ
ncbi:MAG: tetratricopeptide repeat protein [Cyanobacteria bacterium P01_H01_bin.74]